MARRPRDINVRKQMDMGGRTPLVSAYVDGVAYHFDVAEQAMASDFGGPIDVVVSGVAHGPRPLHRIATLGWKDIEILRDKSIFSLPLIYGMCYEGGRLTYRLASPNEICVTKIDPATSLDNFPYDHYPYHLPYVPLRVVERLKTSWQEFSESIPNVSAELSCDVFVIVPPPATIGFSLWGRTGDAESVLIAWEVSLGKEEVRAYTLCT